MRFIIWAFFMFSTTFYVFGRDNFVSIKATSKSGKTLVIGHGTVQRIKENELGAFFVFDGEIEKPSFTFISEAKCIKHALNESIWYLNTPASLGDLEGGEIVLVTKSQMLNGHAVNSNIGKVIYSDPQSIRKIHGEQTFPIWLQERYLTGKNISIDSDDDDFDFMDDEDEQYDTNNQVIVDEVLEFEEDAVDQGDRYIEEFGRYANVKLLKRLNKKELIREKERSSERAELLNLSKGSFSKIDRYENGIVDLYEDVSVDRRDLVEDGPGIDNSFQQYNMATRGIKRGILEKKKDLKKLDDPLWPSGLSDLELRRYFLSHGIDEHSQRKSLILHNKPSHEFLLRLSFALNRNTTDADPNYQTINKSLFVGYEWHLMKASHFMRYFGLEFGAETTSGQYEIGEGLNAYTYEFAGRMMLNFYLNSLPSAVGKLNWYIGAGGKIGNAVVNSLNLSQKYNYFQVTLPSFQAGVKYRFRAGDEYDVLPKIGLGWNLAMIMDNHSFYNSRELFDNIKANFYAGDIKFVLGIGLFF